MEFLRAWTRQHISVLDMLNTEGVYRVSEAFIREKNGPIASYYLDLYRWYTQEAARLVPLPPGVQWPIWLFLEKVCRLPPVEGTVTLELEIPRDQIVITDEERSGYRVNYLYIPLDAEDAAAHDRELRRQGIVNETALIQTGKGNFYPLLRQKIIASWSRVFEKPAGGYTVAQGTVWELRQQWLRGVEYAQG